MPGEEIKMVKRPVCLRDGVTLFRGEISRHLLLRPMVSNAYLLENEDHAILFDPSCGKRIARRIDTYIRSRQQAGARWSRAHIVAGHSHMDHAGNLSLAGVFRADESHVVVHERGFTNDQVRNMPRSVIERELGESRDYYNIYLSLAFPYRLFMLPLAAVDVISRRLALKAFAAMAALPWPRPASESIQPEPLRENALQTPMIGGERLKAWPLGDVFILPTPGHSPCSVSLVWPERGILLVSDADWLGNPVFVSSSLSDSISSLQALRSLTESAGIDLLCPAHGEPKKGTREILAHFDFRIRRLEVIRDEILSAFEASGGDRDIRRLTRQLIATSPFFKAMRLLDYPNLVSMVHNIVTVCLREEGILR